MKSSFFGDSKRAFKLLSIGNLWDFVEKISAMTEFLIRLFYTSGTIGKGRVGEYLSFVNVSLRGLPIDGRCDIVALVDKSFLFFRGAVCDLVL